MKMAQTGMLATLLLGAGCTQGHRGIVAKLPDPLFASPVASRPLAQTALPFPVPPALSGATNREPPGWRPPGGISDRWQHIVIHHSGCDRGGAQAFHEFHTTVRHWDELGYHFVIGNGTDTPDGLVEVGSRWTKQKHGAHCKVPGNFYNNHGIGVCLVGNFEDYGPTPSQMASLEDLVRFLMAACEIPLDHVRTHGGITGRTACPGRHFPMLELRRRLAVPRAGIGDR